MLLYMNAFIIISLYLSNYKSVLSAGKVLENKRNLGTGSVFKVAVRGRSSRQTERQWSNCIINCLMGK